VADTPLNLKDKFPYQVWELTSESREPDLFQDETDVLDSSLYGNKYRLIISKAADARSLLHKVLQAKGYTVTGLQKILPSMEDVFVMMARGGIK
jgi:ABC-2 type transport system ATP-binding protein